jgi:hypothetical protein
MLAEREDRAVQVVVQEDGEHGDRTARRVPIDGLAHEEVVLVDAVRADPALLQVLQPSGRDGPAPPAEVLGEGQRAQGPELVLIVVGVAPRSAQSSAPANRLPLPQEQVAEAELERGEAGEEYS